MAGWNRCLRDGDCGILHITKGDWATYRERTPGLVAHQGDVAGVVEDLMDIGHVAAQERTLGCAVHVSDEIQSDGCQHNGGQPSGSSSICQGLLEHLYHVILLRIL